MRAAWVQGGFEHSHAARVSDRDVPTEKCPRKGPSICVAKSGLGVVVVSAVVNRIVLTSFPTRLYLHPLLTGLCDVRRGVAAFSRRATTIGTHWIVNS